ncbi:MAG: hypothetical protein O7C75_16205 [Verrucomicrobia bacterium]|nr:hypothetical protein [Verrucomicrobiota bacterium]
MWPLAAAGQAALPYTRGEVLHRDSLNDLSNWVVEQMPGGSVNVQSRKLEIDDAKGCTGLVPAQDGCPGDHRI